jgi:phosphoribosylaminoimidazole-succinocarboxamide synthase
MQTLDWEPLVAATGRPFGGLAELGIAPAHAGKVREILDLGERLLIVTTDRISAFDQVLPSGIPGRGIMLNQISVYWFERLAEIVPHHMISIEPDSWPATLQPHRDALLGRTMTVHRARRVPVECVVRGWLAGSGVSAYQADGAICGVPLPPGLQPFDRLPEPIFTPTTKADEGHDEPMSPAELEGLVGAELAGELARLSLALYERAAAYAEARGVIIADTKFEFGWIGERLCLIDEALTPDSSRFWPRESVGAGRTPVSLDKQAVRDFLKSQGWHGEGAPPALPAAVIAETRERYAEALRRITGGERG